MMQSLAALGISGKPSNTTPQGLEITAFTGTTESPLKAMGMKAGDVIIKCNGEQQQMGKRLPAAFKDLQDNGKAVTCVILRDGKEMTLTRSEKMPAAK
jgi:S1-C subfamily serine protease